MLAKGATDVAEPILRKPSLEPMITNVLTSCFAIDNQLSTINYIMIATKVPPQPLLEAQLPGLLAEAPRADQSTPNSSDRLPNSERVYVESAIYKDIRVPMREIGLAPTKSFNGQLEVNEPVRVYDTSGPWGDPGFKGCVEEGLPPLRAEWIRARGDVEEYEGRPVRPID